MIQKNFNVAFVADLALREKQFQQNFLDYARETCFEDSPLTGIHPDV